MPTSTMNSWTQNRIVPKERDQYLRKGESFIPESSIVHDLEQNTQPDKGRIRAIIQKSLSIQTLLPQETAALLHVTDPELIAEMEQAAGTIKHKVYDNRIVTFAPLYLSSRCVNNCLYCGFRSGNNEMTRGVLDPSQIRGEIEVLAGKIGHKRLIAVYGEHPSSDAQYIADSMQAIYAVKIKTRRGIGSIRRINVNAPPMQISDLALLKEKGIGTYQVFQETYHRPTYETMHPQGTLKHDYPWRLYSMHRAMEAGIDDVGIGVLFGLYDWRFEVMALLHHALELESTFGIGPHTISFPRLEPAHNAPQAQTSEYRVSDADFRRAVTVIRLSVPYTGMILTARENAALRREIIPLGCTQTDASTKIGLGAYSRDKDRQEEERQQFVLGDTRALDEVVRDLASLGMITSFCTAGYRCGRTGHGIMDMLRSGEEGKFCKLNAVITFREWLDDFASEETRTIGERVIRAEVEEIRSKSPVLYAAFEEQYKRTVQGERDLYF